MSTTARPPAVVLLVGAPGAGKSTVGRILAETLGATYLDTDDFVARAAARTSAAEVMTEDGEERFRSWEGVAVGEALDSAAGEKSGAVVAIGSGAVAEPAVRDLLSTQMVAWLRVTAANAATRTGLNAIRPVALGNIRAQFAAQLRAREPWYDEVSTFAVETDHRQPAEIAAEIAAWLATCRDEEVAT